MKEYLQQVAQRLGNKDVEVRLHFGVKEYIRLLGDTYLASQYKEITEPNLQTFIDRALTFYDQYLTHLAIRRRQSKAV